MRTHNQLAWMVVLFVATIASAQTMYKYTDKDGKVTYSDRLPKPGEKAEAITVDAKANVVHSEAKQPNGAVSRGGTEAQKRAMLRDDLSEKVELARKDLDDARNALESGRDPTEDERQIVVRKDGNSVQRKPAYFERIAKLEADIKAAEERLAKAEMNYRRGAPN